VKAVWMMVAHAAAGFFVLFNPWTKNMIPFFPLMTITAVLLAAVSLILEPNRSLYTFKPDFIVMGILAAVVLYGMFWIGHFVSRRIFLFAAAQVDSIYALRAGQNPWQMALLLFFLIGPAEEIFWRICAEATFETLWRLHRFHYCSSNLCLRTHRVV